jgi:hypothetical protein
MSSQNSPRRGGAVEVNGRGNGVGPRFNRKTVAAEGRAQGLDIGWTVFGYLAAGMLAYGAIGWLIGRAVHVALLFPVGMLIGLAISIGYIIYRYGKQGAVERAAPPPRKEMTGDR